MKNLVFLAFLALVGFAVAGYFLDWYNISGSPTSGGQTRLQIDVDTHKIKEDLSKGQAKIKETIEKARQGADDDPSPEPVSKPPRERY
jgi:hypothetical protein